MLHETRHGQQVALALPSHLGLVGLLQLLLVDVDLVLVLRPQLGQRLGQLALKLLLPAAVDLHDARLVSTLRLTQLLQKKTKNMKRR